VLQGYEKALGPDHILTLKVLHSLAYLRKDQGKLDEVDKMYQRALQGHKKALGLDHIETLMVLQCLANLCIEQGKLDEADKMFQQVL
jgi:tetratricopeptide (TPR) repeat protein